MKRIVLCLLLTFCTTVTLFGQEKYTVAQIKDLTKQARKEAQSQYILGCCYEEGNGVKTDAKKAVDWFKKAARQGHSDAQYRLGMCYMNGTGIKKDIKKAEDLLLKSNTADAQYELGRFYASDARLVPEKDRKIFYKKALHWYHKAAVQNHSKACYEIGRYFLNGWGKDKDLSSAVAWIRKASDLGYPVAQNHLGFMYQKGNGVPADGVMALALYEKAAAGGNTTGAFNAAYCYEFGIGTQMNKAEAARRYESLASKDDSSKLRLGYLLENGSEGVAKDPQRAFDLYCSASVNNKKALYHVGRCYENGIGVKANKGKALSSYKEAMENGDGEANLAYSILKDSDKLEPKEKKGNLFRTEKMMEDLWKVLAPKDYNPSYLYSYGGYGWTREAFLDELPSKYRTTLEEELLDCYAEVFIIKETPQWYYVVDDDNSVGIVTLDGDMLCLPLPGKIRMALGGFNFMLLGDETPDDVFMEQFKLFMVSALGTPVGYGQAVLNWKKGEYIVPLGSYVSVSFARRMMPNSYYVSRIVDGEIKWGLLDKDGRVEIPVQYKGIGVEGGHFLMGGAVQLMGGDYVGRNDKTIDQITEENYERYYKKVQQQQKLAGTLMTLGNAMMSVAQVLPDSKSAVAVSGGAQDSGKTTVSSVSKHKAKKPEDIVGAKTGVHNVSELLNHQTARDIYSECERELIHMSIFRDYYSTSAREEFQSQMKRIRKQQESQGRKMRYSKWEDWDGVSEIRTP